MIDRSDILIQTKDMRVGMGIGGWHMRHTYTHEPTGTSISFETQGSQNTFQLREDMIAMLALIENHIGIWNDDYGNLRWFGFEEVNYAKLPDAFASTAPASI